MFALFNFVPISKRAVFFSDNFSALSEAIQKEYGALPDYENIHDWLSAHWKRD